jgi:uncharacterized protein
MPISMHDLSVAVYTRMLGNLSGCLDKAAAYAAEEKFDGAVLVNARLAPDMFPLARQVQIACDFAKGGCARLAGVEVPKREDNETTLDQLKARIAWTKEFIGSIPREKFTGAEERPIVHEMRTLTVKLPGLAYLEHFSLPNFYFHLTTAYAILRHNGVPVGKGDYVRPD